MKQCPSCNRTYEDTQQFCMQDGTPLVGSTAYAPPPPPPPQQPPSWGPTPPPAAAPPKRKLWPWVLGGLVLLIGGGFLLLMLIGFVAYKYSDTNNTTGAVNTNTRSGANTNTYVEPPVDTANTEQYVNSRAAFADGPLASNYVDFSFRYPKTWKLDPDPAPSFVRVERATPAGNTIENFSVGWFSVTGGGSGAGNTALLSQTINNLSSQVSGNFPNYEKVGEGTTTIGRYSGYELRFSGSTLPGKKGLPYWGRIVILPDPNGSSKGVSLIMLTTGNSKEVKSQADVGEKGELPIILKTFRLGATP